MKKTLPKIILGLALLGVLVSCNKDKTTSSSSSITNSSTQTASSNTSTSNLPSVSSTSPSISSTANPDPTNFEVTFKAILAQPLASYEAIYVAGSFKVNGDKWDESCKMTKESDLVYKYAITLDAGEYEYRFALGTANKLDWSCQNTTAANHKTNITYATRVVEHNVSFTNRPGDPSAAKNIQFNVTIPDALNAWEKLFIIGIDGWTDDDAIELNKVDDTHYTTTISLSPSSIAYKFCLSDNQGAFTWAYQDTTLGATPGNRTFTVTSETTLIENTISSWAGRSSNPVTDIPEEIDVTFTATLPRALHTWEKLFVAGGYGKSWDNPFQFELNNKISDTEYSAIVKMMTGSIYYKYFLSDNQGAFSWNFGEDKAMGNDRDYGLTTEYFTPTDTINAWSAEPSDPNASEDPEEIDVTFTATLPRALHAWEKVFVAGGYGDKWADPFQFELDNKISDTEHSATVKMMTGSIYYKYFLSDNQGVFSWNYGEDKAMGNDRDYGLTTEYFTPTDTINAWSAEPSDPNASEPEAVDVVFNVTIPDALNGWEKLFIIGVKGWAAADAIELNKVDNTHYTTTISLLPSSIGYKYCLSDNKGGFTWDYQDATLGRNNPANRTFTITSETTLIENTISSWASRSVDPNTSELPEEVDVTFTVTLPDALNAWEKVFVAGGYGQFWANSFQFELDNKISDTEYSTTVKLLEGEISYKYFLSDSFGNFSWNYGENKEYGNNRDYDLTTEYFTPMDTVEAWSARPVELMEVTIIVTLKVDVTEGANVYIVGDAFGGWNEKVGTLMTKTGELEYTAVVFLEPGITYQYKYIYFDTTLHWENWGGNRSVTISAETPTLNDTLWGW